MRALMKLGAVFKVYRGCPMLRAENVLRHGPADEHLRAVACEFASDEMRIVVQNALLGVDAIDDDTADNTASNDATADAAADAAVAAREWDDAPLCAIMHEHTLLNYEVDIYVLESTSMAVDFSPVLVHELSFEAGKRLNRMVMAMLHHYGFGDACVSLFTGPEKVIIVAKLRRFPKLYRELFSTAANWFGTTRIDGCFRAHDRGVFVFGRSTEVVNQALTVVERVKKLALEPSMARLLECERQSLLPLSADDVSFVATSIAALEYAIRSHGDRLRAISLSFGAAAIDAAELERLLQRGAGGLRAVCVLGWKSAPVQFFERLLASNRSLIVSWHTAGAIEAKRVLARTFPSRFCLLSTIDTDAVQIKKSLLAMDLLLDQSTADALVGTHRATLALRSSAIRQCER
jgi:hypothetical protein